MLFPAILSAFTRAFAPNGVRGSCCSVRSYQSSTACKLAQQELRNRSRHACENGTGESFRQGSDGIWHECHNAIEKFGNYVMVGVFSLFNLMFELFQLFYRIRSGRLRCLLDGVSNGLENMIDGIGSRDGGDTIACYVFGAYITSSAYVYAANFEDIGLLVSNLPPHRKANNSIIHPKPLRICGDK